MMKSVFPRGLLWLQALLLAIELFGSYDTVVRRLALALTNILGVLIIWWVAKRFQKWGSQLPSTVCWLAMAGIWFDAAGNFANLYASISWWDKLAHAVGTAAVTAAVWYVVQLWAHKRQQSPTTLEAGLVTIALTNLLATLYEISEYIGDLLVATHRVTDLFDTVDDLVFNLLASLLVVWILASRRRRTR